MGGTIYIILWNQLLWNIYLLCLLLWIEERRAPVGKNINNAFQKETSHQTGFGNYSGATKMYICFLQATEALVDFLSYSKVYLFWSIH